MKKIMTSMFMILCIVCGLLFTGCGKKVDPAKTEPNIEQRLEETSKEEFEKNVLTEMLKDLRTCGFDDLDVEYDFLSKEYNSNEKVYNLVASLKNFKSENSIVRLAGIQDKLRKSLKKTMNAYVLYRGKVYEWKTEQGEIVKVVLQLPEDDEINISNSKGESYGIRLNKTKNTYDYLNNLQVTDSEKIVTEVEKSESGENSKVSTSGQTVNKKLCRRCGERKTCKDCGSYNFSHYRRYGHLCDDCWEDRYCYNCGELNCDGYDCDYWDDDRYNEDDGWDDYDDYYDYDDWDDDDFYYDGDYWDE